MSAYSTAVLADTPLLFWELDDLSGTVAADASGNSRTGTYSGTYTQNSPPLVNGGGRSVVFDGASGKIASPVLTAITGDFSAEFWCKVSPSAGYTQGDNFGLWGGATKSRMMPRPGGYYFSVWIGGVEQVMQFNPGGDVHTNKVVYWCIQRSGTALKLYRGIVGTDANPVQIDSVASVATTAVDLSGSLANEPNSAAWFKGPIDEVALYAAALTTTRMNAHYTAGLLLRRQSVSPSVAPSIAPSIGGR